MIATIKLFDTKFIVEFYPIKDFGTNICPDQSNIHIETLKVYDSEIDILPIIEMIRGYKEKILDEINKWL